MALLTTAAVIILVSLKLSPYFDDINLVKLYSQTMKESLATSLLLCIGLPIIVVFMNRLITEARDDIRFFSKEKLGLFTFSILLTLSLAYHAGKMDSFKIAIGYDFFYILDNQNTPHKYLGKLDKYFIFADNNTYITSINQYTFKKPVKLQIDRISIVSDDSIKSLQLTRFKTLEKPPIDNGFYKIFTPIIK